MIAVLDYGMGNLRSVERAIRFLGHDCVVSDRIGSADKVVLPGVGAFAEAMRRLEPARSGLDAFVARGGRLLGICLGQQLLFESSEEFGHTPGLGYLPGRVEFLPMQPGLKRPHMGWAPIDLVRPHPMFEGIEPQDQVFFVHSLYTDCEPVDRVASCAYGGLSFPAAVARGAIWGAQFHPEKSGRVGLRILRNFLEC